MLLNECDILNWFRQNARAEFVQALSLAVEETRKADHPEALRLEACPEVA